MFYDQSESDGDYGLGSTGSGERLAFNREDSHDLSLSPESVPDQSELSDSGDWGQRETFSFGHGGYERELIQSVWEFAEMVAGNDPELWRKDEFGEWIYRFDYGRRSSEFGWEIFDPGVGRHAQGVYAMRPMQWQNYIRQYEAFA